MKSVIVIFCLAGTLVGWLATHLGTSGRIIRGVGDDWASGPVETVRPPAETMPVNAKKGSEQLKE